MQYFTPELYLQFNSADDAEVDRAETAWDAAIQNYQRYLKTHRAKMPANVRALAGTYFHDAWLLDWQIHEFGPKRRMATLSLQQKDTITELIYFLWDSPRRGKRRKNWPFSPENVCWLYDEIEVVDDCPSLYPSFGCLQRVLLSDGSELEIPFSDVVLHRIPAKNPKAAAVPR
jgi:hypothetical protein